MKEKTKNKANNKISKGKIKYIPLRYVIAILITLFEVVAILGIVFTLCIYVPYFYALCYLTQILCVLKIISSDDNPDYKIPWLLFVLVLPVVGFMLYFIFYSRKLKYKFVKKLRALKNQSYAKDDSELIEKLAKEEITAANQAKMLTKMAESHLFSNTKQTYFKSSEEMHAQILKDLKKAEKFIYMEYFIIEEGIFWNSILDILKEKAADGIEVKIVYDDIGCMKSLPGNYCKTLKKYGIEATPFSRLKGSADREFNNRNHRKITVIDGKIGYTGGINFADRYINIGSPHGHWKDTGIRIEGEAVLEFTKLFMVDFGISIKGMPNIKNDIFPQQWDKCEDGYLVPFGDGPTPLYNFRVGKGVIESIINDAKRYVYITTPYLVIDNDLCQTIENAALRGVDVRILMPHISDSRIMFAMGRSFYPRLMKAGAKIYEYEPGFIHAKSYIADDEYGMIGSINLDYRSLVHHFENGIWMYKCSCLKDLKKDIEETLEKSIEINENMLKISVIQRIFRAIVRIFSPLL